MLKLRRVLALIILVAVALVGALVWRHLYHQPVRELLEGLPREINLALDQLNYTETRDGQKRWSLSSERAEYLRESNLVRLTPVDLTFYEAGPYGELTLRADRGEFHEETRRVEVSGNVVIDTPDGESITTDALVYEDRQRQLSTEAPIHYRAPGRELTGVGLLIDLEQNTLIVEKNVWMRVYPESKESSSED